MVKGSLYQHITVRRSIYEIWEIRPPRENARRVVIKQDPGAELTLISPLLYDYVKERGMLQDEIQSDDTAVSFTAGAGAIIKQSASFPVFLPEFMLPIWIQVIRMPGMVHNINHILLGLDNSAKLGLILDLRVGKEMSTYHSVPCSGSPITSEHQAQDLVSRQFAGCEFGCVEKPAEVASIGGDSLRACASGGTPEAQSQAQEKSSDAEPQSSRRCEDEEMTELEEAIEEMSAARRANEKIASVQEINQEIHEAYNLKGMRMNYGQEYEVMEKIERPELQALEELVTTGEAAVNTVTAAREWLSTAPIDWKGDEIPIIDAATVPGGLSKDAVGGSVSIAFKVNEETGTISPIDMNSKQKGDHAAHAWRKFTKKEILDQILEKAQEDGIPLTAAMLPEGFIDDLHGSGQPESEELPVIKGHYFYIRLKKNYVPWKAKYRSVPRQLLGRLKTILDKMESMGMIEKGESDTTCALSLVLKAGADGKTTIDRVAVDARPLNEQIERDTEQIPVADMLFQFAEGAFIYTALDLVKAFFQVSLWKPMRKLAAIATPLGTYLIRRMFFGIATSSSAMQQLVEQTVGDDLYGMAAAGASANEVGDEGAVVFVDDVLAYTKKRKGESESHVIIRHFELVARIVKRFRKRNMTISVEKSYFGRQTIKYLGFMLGREGMSIDKQKQSAILDAPHPRTAAEVHRLIGAAIWLGRVLRCNLSNLLAPLRKYVQMRPHDKTYVTQYKADDPAVIRAVKAVKERIANAVTLKPVDWNRPMEIFTDAAQSKGIGMVLAQWYDAHELGKGGVEIIDKIDEKSKVAKNGEKSKNVKLDANDQTHRMEFQDNKEQNDKSFTPPPAPLNEEGSPRQGAYVPLYFASKSINPNIHGRWDAREIECYALCLALHKFEMYCMGSVVNLHSDSKSLEYMNRYANQYGKIGRWLNYFSLHKTNFSWTRGLSMGLPDYLSRAPVDDLDLSEDGERESHKLKVEDIQRQVLCSPVEATDRFTRVHGDPWSCDVTEQFKPRTARVEAVVDQQLTMFSVCSGIGSAQMAVERAGLPIKTIGACEVDPDCVEVFSEAFPGVPVYGDVRTVIQAIEQKDLILNPDILELTMPCQARSCCRVLADWSDTVHPSARLWDLQATLVKLCNPKVVVIENVPPFNNEKKKIDTRDQFEQLQMKITQLGYVYRTKILRASLYGDATQRTRYIAIATRSEYIPVELPVGNKKLFKGFWSLLEPREQVGMKYRCMRDDGNSEFVMIKTRGDDSDRHMSKQVGRVMPQGDKEKAVAESQNTNNPKGFRIYAPSHAHCVITSYGNPSKTGPGRQTQYILDHVGVRTLSVREACRIHSFTTKVEEILSTRREAVALAMIGNSIPVKMYARVFMNIVSNDWDGPDGEVKVEALEKSTNGMMDLVDPNLEDADKPLTEEELEEVQNFYPDDATLAQAQKDDVEWASKREQLQLLLDEPKATLNETRMRKMGISPKRIKELMHLHLRNDVLCHSALAQQFYDRDGKAVPMEQEPILLKIVPAKLQDMVTYLHHYSMLAAHASPAQMWEDMQDAGYWYPGGHKRCQKVYKSCHRCFRAHQTRSALHGLHTSRRFRASGECVSWDCSFYGGGGPTIRGNNYCLVLLDEFDMWIDLIPLKTKEATEVSAALVLYILRYGTPMLLWSGRDTELNNTCVRLVCEKLRVKQMYTTARNSNALARNERQHRVVNETLKLLVQSDTKDWDTHLPLVEHTMRNKVKDGGFSPFQLRHGRRMRHLGMLQKGDVSPDEKRFPKAREYMKTLRYSLHEMWRQLTMWNIEAQCAVWAEDNKNRVEKTYQVGDFVMVHQPLRVKGAASRLLHNWVGPFKVAKLLGHKQYDLQHIDRNSVTQQTVSNMHTAPDEMYEGEYDERVNRMNTLAKGAPPPHLKDDDMVIVDTGNGLYPAQIGQTLEDGTVLIYFWNGQQGKFKVKSAIYPAYLEPSAAKLKEVYTYLPNAAQEVRPIWNIVPTDSIVGLGFTTESKGGKQYLPKATQQMMEQYMKKDKSDKKK